MNYGERLRALHALQNHVSTTSHFLKSYLAEQKNPSHNRWTGAAAIAALREIRNSDEHFHHLLDKTTFLSTILDEAMIRERKVSALC